MVGEHVSLLNLQAIFAIFSFTNKRTVNPPLTSFLFTQSFCGDAWKSQETHARLFQDGSELSPHTAIKSEHMKDKETSNDAYFLSG